MFRHPYVFDGQHTIEIVASRSGSRDTPVWCMVYDQLQYQEEAHIFAEQQRHVKALVPYESFKAHIEANDRTHLPLTIWFWAIYLCATDKRGISAKGLARQLEVSYESAWYLLVRIRSAMKDRDQNYMLEGLIEMDEAYLGAPKRGKKRGRGTERKKMAVAVSKTESDCPLFLRLQIIPDVTTASLQDVINGNVKPGSTIECDGLKSYPALENVSIDASTYEIGDLKWVHVAIGNFKAFLLGTYHGSCGDYQPYLNEFCFRYNRRFHPAELFTRLSRAVATSYTLLN